MRRAPLGALAVLAVLTYAPGAAGASGDSVTAAAKTCGKASVGYTTARVYARNIACRRARRFIHRWARERRTNCTEANGFCRVTRRKGFRCVRGGSDYVVELACRRGDQRIRAFWGD